MTPKRHFARMLVRLALPCAVLLAAGSPLATANTRPTNDCTYGRYYAYYDANGSLCAESETCTNTGWGDCDEDGTYVSTEDFPHVCYCEP